MKYIDADQICSEIEREMGEITYGAGEPKSVYEFCEQLLAFPKTLPEQPVEGLESFNAAFDKYMKEHWTRGTQIKDVANYFYELGCRRAAEKYDEIE